MADVCTVPVVKYWRLLQVPGVIYEGDLHSLACLIPQGQTPAKNVFFNENEITSVSSLNLEGIQIFWPTVEVEVGNIDQLAYRQAQTALYLQLSLYNLLLRCLQTLLCYILADALSLKI